MRMGFELFHFLGYNPKFCVLKSHFMIDILEHTSLLLQVFYSLGLDSYLLFINELYCDLEVRFHLR
jgi:hypothetical protein